MAKAPRPGHVKTRLHSVLEPHEAARLGAAFLRDITENLHEAARRAPIAPFVAYAPLGEEGRFDGLLAAGTALVLADGSGGDADGVEGFGRVLLHATRSLLDMGYGAACVLNADSPTLPTALLAEAATRLLAPGSRAVLGPADDGGYWLLGLQTAEPRLYARIGWSTDRAATETASRAREAGLPLDLLATWYDVDDRAALERLAAELGDATTGPLAPYRAAATARCLAELRIADRLRAEPAGA
ncbi:MAG: TIGR04282 family arsenosugar biosynthesis glycosyltransferase [Acetobacteraceae bacterium]